MDVCIVALVVAPQGIHNNPRFLRRCCVVEVNQGTAMHLLVKDRKVCASLGPIHLLLSFFWSYGFGDHFFSTPFKATQVAVWLLRSSCPGSRAGPKRVRPQRHLRLRGLVAYSGHLAPASGPCHSRAR